MKHAKSAFHRGEIVLFRQIHCTNKEHSSADLLVGIIQDVTSYYKINREQVSCSFVLCVHVVGKCCTSQIYPDRIQNSMNPSNSLTWPLKHFRREVTSKRIQNTKIEVDGNMDSSEIMCSHVKCLDDIIIASRQLVVNESPFARMQINVWESGVLRPTTFYKKIKRMLDFFETKNIATLILIKTKQLLSWKEKAKQLSSLRLLSASAHIQRYFRGYIVRKRLAQRPDRFEGYYVPESMTSTVRCYKIRAGVYLSTQAKANEYFSLISKSIGIMARLSLGSGHARMSVAMKRWKHAIAQQNIELKRMSDEELFSIM